MLHTNRRRLCALALAVLAGILLPVSIGAQPATAETAAPATGESAARSTAEEWTTGENAASPARLAAAPRQTGADPLASDAVITDTVSPVGTTINLFDYWITTRDAPDTTNPPDMDQGINQGKLLQFTAAAPTRPNGGINDFTGSAKPRTGIVQDLLQNNYPILSQGDQSLNYLFDPTLANPGKASYPAVRDLLQIDDQGYYYYDSARNFAQYDQNTNAFILYDSPGVVSGGSSGQAGQFFPFNAYSQVKNLRSDNAALNHYFGVTMTTRFVQQPNGTVDGTAGGIPVTYEFTGDDDVWVFIDNVLVGDLGGIHNAASLKIDFQNGQVFINNSLNGTIRDKFDAAGVPWTNAGSDTFADNTYHTLKFFYLERGNYDSNMKLKFNLVSIPQSDLIKVDQIGDPVPGAEFRLYYAKDDYSYDPQDLIATGTTGANGYFVFQNPDGTLVSLNNLKNTYGGPGQTGKFALVESVTPEGYRSPSQIDLYFPQGYDELATLLSANPWDTGAYASPVVTTTLPDAPEGLDGTTYSADNGTYFAVVLKRQDAAGSGSSTQSQWYPVSGDPITGWTVQSGTSLQDVLTAARANPYLFTLDSSGAYKTTIDNLPGSILTYYYVLATNGKLSGDNARYTVGFYRTSAPNLAGATPQNTVRLNDDLTDQYGSFQREFSVRLFVPDIKNYFFVQKVGEDNAAPLVGAEFALYRAADVTDGQVNPGAQPYDTVTTADLSQDRGDIITLNGAGTFPNTKAVLPAGTYYLKELSAPAGYAPSDQLTRVVVDNTGVYADAGTPTDDVTVLRGVGKVVRSMLQFAVPDDIDVTLTDIRASLYTADSYTPGTGNDWAVWTPSSEAPLDLSYYSSNQILEYGPTTPGNPVYFLISAGWSRLRITQNYAAGTDQALKTNLGDQNLSNLFSRSTIVRYRNDPTRLTVTKTVTGFMGDETKEFAFTLTLTAPDGAPLTGTYGGLAFDAEGKAETTLRDKERLVFENLEPGTVFTITEAPADQYRTTVQLNDEDPRTANELTVTLPAGSTTVAFTNTSTLQPTPSPTPTPTPTTAPTSSPAPTAAPTAGPSRTPAPTPESTLPASSSSQNEATPAPEEEVLPASTPQPAGEDRPATGDPFRPWVWVVLLGGAGTALLLTAAFRLRREKE